MVAVEGRFALGRPRGADAVARRRGKGSSHPRCPARIQGKIEASTNFPPAPPFKARIETIAWAASIHETPGEKGFPSSERAPTDVAPIERITTNWSKTRSALANHDQVENGRRGVTRAVCACVAPSLRAHMAV